MCRRRALWVTVWNCIRSAAIFGVMAGGEVAGILGIFLSIPVMASLRIVFRRWRLYAQKRKFGPLNEYVRDSQVGIEK